MAAEPNSSASTIPQRIEGRRIGGCAASAIRSPPINVVSHDCRHCRALAYLARTGTGDRRSSVLLSVTTGYHSVKIRKFSPLGGTGGTLR